MAIKSEIINSDKPEKQEYPCLKVSSDGVVVIFSKPCEGMVIKEAADGIRYMGRYTHGIFLSVLEQYESSLKEPPK